MGMPNTFPFEVIGSPFSIYIAPAATARPLIDAVPAVDWVLLGSNGNKSYAEEGVRVNIPQSFNYFRGLGSAAPLKAFRSEEDAIIQVSLADMSLEVFRQALNQNEVREAGITRTVGLSRGLTVATVALLVRGPSPYMNDAFCQWWMPYAVNVSNPEVAFRRDNATIYALEWRAIVDPAAALEADQLGIFEAESDET
jgi:hypothetical protein